MPIYSLFHSIFENPFLVPVLESHFRLNSFKSRIIFVLWSFLEEYIKVGR